MDMPLLRAVDAVTVPVPDLDEGIAFYRDRLGHPLRWRNDDLGQAAVGVAEGRTEIVLTTRHGYEPNWLVDSAEAAASAFEAAGGRILSPPADIPVGQVAVVADPFDNVLVLVDLSKGRYDTDAAGHVTGVVDDVSPRAGSGRPGRKGAEAPGHAPAGYACPFCRNIATGEADLPLEIVHRDEDVFVKVNPRWSPRNPGSVLVIPIEHHENVYDLPPELGTPIQRAVRAAALAMKAAYGCDGVSTRQHNEPAGNQDVWHYHVHVFPRWEGDGLYRSEKSPADPAELRRRADLLRSAWPET